MHFAVDRYKMAITGWGFRIEQEAKEEGARGTDEGKIGKTMYDTKSRFASLAGALFSWRNRLLFSGFVVFCCRE